MKTKFKEFNINENRWFTVKKTQLDYWEKVITDTYARKILGSVILKKGRCSERQYNILKLAVEGNITPSLFGTKN